MDVEGRFAGIQSPTTSILNRIDLPREEIYWVPVHDYKILISLATHLEREDIVKMEIGNLLVSQRNWMLRR
jgi:hypothetical protein